MPVQFPRQNRSPAGSGEDHADPGGPASRWRIAVIIVSILAMAVIAGDLIARRSGHASPVASDGLRPWDHSTAADVIKRGYERAEADEGRDNEDPDLTADEAAAGALWAKAHHPVSTDQCPIFMEAFRQGCMDYVKRAAGR